MTTPGIDVALQNAIREEDWMSWYRLASRMGLVSDETIAMGFRIAALYNHSRPQGMGLLHFKNEVMSVDKGRVMKINTKRFDDRLYDRDNGDGAFILAIECKGCSKCKEAEKK